MYSLLENVDEKIDIHILHNQDIAIEIIPVNIVKHKNLNNIQIYQVDLSNYNFPNLENVHVSEATYYRIFLARYLPKDLDQIIYIDADIVCVNNPIKQIKVYFEKIKKNKGVISARTEHKFSKNNEIFERLSKKSDYFNAGFLLINLNEWRINNIEEKLIHTMEKNYKNIVQWDQDVLNIFFDFKYEQLSDSFNFNSNKLNNKSQIKNEEILFIHYIGSKKPWGVPQKIDEAYQIYHTFFENLKFEKYHITHTWKTNSIKNLFNLIISGEIKKLSNPTSYIICVLKSLI